MAEICCLADETPRPFHVICFVRSDAGFVLPQNVLRAAQDWIVSMRDDLSSNRIPIVSTITLFLGMWADSAGSQSVFLIYGGISLETTESDQVRERLEELIRKLFTQFPFGKIELVLDGRVSVFVPATSEA